MILRTKTLSIIAFFCGDRPVRFYIMWGLFSFLMSVFLGRFYFVLGFFHSILLLFSPLLFLMFTWFLGDDKRLEPLLSIGHNFVQFIIFFAHISTLFYIWFYVGNEYWNGQKGNLFYIAPCLFFLSWCLNARNALHRLQWILQKAWWINITLEGKYAPSTGSSRDIHVNRKSIDRTLFIWGEPRKWWEYRLRDPESIAILRILKKQRLGLSATLNNISCDPQIESAAKEWRQHLERFPPTLQDWKDSGYRFTTSAHETIQASSRAGSPIAVPSLGEETKDNQR